MPPASFFEKRVAVLLSHWSVVLATAAVLYFGDHVPGWSLHEWLMAFLLTVHAGVSLLLPARFRQTSVVYGLALLNLAGACLAVSLSNPPDWSVLGLLPLGALIARISAGAPGRAAGAATVALCYVGLLYFASRPVGIVGWAVCLLLFATCHHFAYLFHLEGLDADRARASTLYTTELFELGNVLARPDDPMALQERIPRLVADIMRADNCELGFVKNDLITQRILPNRHCRDFVDLQIKNSIHEKTLAGPDTYSTPDLQEEPKLASKQDHSLYPYRAYMGRAWRVQGRPAGFMALYMEKKFTWNAFDRKKFQFLVNQTVLALQNAELRQELENQARSDGLTRLFNHRYFYEWLEEEFARTKRKNHQLSVVVLDLDYFKQLNDTSGHRVGDLALEALGKLLRDSVRSMDRVGRLGGDEFAVALPETSLNDAFTLCKRILQATAKLRVGDQVGFSLSMGCATFPQDGETLNEVMEHADEALYLSKRLGRGRASRYSDVRAEKESADRLTG